MKPTLRHIEQKERSAEQSEDEGKVEQVVVLSMVVQNECRPTVRERCPWRVGTSQVIQEGRKMEASVMPVAIQVLETVLQVLNWGRDFEVVSRAAYRSTATQWGN